MANEEKPNPAAMWDERFARSEPVYGEEPNAYLRAQTELRLTLGMKVLVPGDGYGRNGLWLAKQGFSVTTVDVSSVGVERARKAARAAQFTMKVVLSDLNAWEWPIDRFDAVASIYLHLPPAQRPEIHRRMLHALNEGGVIILEAFTPAQLTHSSGGPKRLELLYTPDMLRQDFAGTEVVELTEMEVELNEGTMHSGKAAVVRGVFRKQ
jgi:cyclopropane fatty-acyl-phospholipid synthase-like methyltransferase